MSGWRVDGCMSDFYIQKGGVDVRREGGLLYSGQKIHHSGFCAIKKYGVVVYLVVYSNWSYGGQ